MRIPPAAFSRLAEGYIVYWVDGGKHYLAYHEDGLQVIEANSLEELLSVVKNIDFIEAKGLCILTEDGVECTKAGFKGSEVVELIKGP
mgnify:CR=1 FL=1